MTIYLVTLTLTLSDEIKSQFAEDSETQTEAELDTVIRAAILDELPSETDSFTVRLQSIRLKKETA